MDKNFTKTDILLIFAASLLPWLPILFTSFLNDDYQIIGYHSSVNFYSLLKPFYTADISGFYWRPLGNFLHVLTLLFFGFNAFAFRLGNALLYSLCCCQAANFQLKLGINKNAVKISVILFALLPSHSFMIGWIASKGEFLEAILIMLSVQYYFTAMRNNDKNGKHLFASLFFFIAALLVKELAFAMVFIPAVFFLLQKKYSQKSFLTALKHTLFAAALIIVYLAVRFIIAGGTPFSSPHFQDRNVVNYIKNFFIYAVISFVNPEVIEQIINSNMLLPLLAVKLLAAAAVIYFIIKNKTKFTDEKQNILLGLMWFCVFILPVLPVLMRWYPFTASIGLLIAAGIILEKIIGAKKYFSVIFWIIVFSLSAYNFANSFNWFSSGKKMDGIIAQLSADNEIKSKDTLIVLGSPDKLNSIPLMKLGVQQTFEYALQKKIEIIAPLRAELFSDRPKIEILSVNGNKINIKITGGIFLPEGMRTSGIKQNDTVKTEINNIKLTVKPSANRNGNIVTEAEVVIDEKYKNCPAAFFNGNKFTLLK